MALAGQYNSINSITYKISVAIKRLASELLMLVFQQWGEHQWQFGAPKSNIEDQHMRLVGYFAHLGARPRMSAAQFCA
jgi:hypothetical protein